MLVVGIDTGAEARFRDRCASVADGASGDLMSVFTDDWDEITFATAGASYDDIAAETGATFDPSLARRSPFDGLIVPQQDGRAVRALNGEVFPYRLANEQDGTVTLPAPGVFVRQGTTCVFEDDGQP